MTDAEFLAYAGIDPSDYGWTIDDTGTVVAGGGVNMGLPSSFTDYGNMDNYYLPWDQNYDFGNPNPTEPYVYTPGPNFYPLSYNTDPNADYGYVDPYSGITPTFEPPTGPGFDIQIPKGQSTLSKILNSIGGGTDPISSLAKLGAGLGNAALQSSAAGKATDAQLAGAKYAADLQYKAQQEALALAREQWLKNQENQAPWLQGGKASLGALLTGMGLGDGTAGPLASGELTKAFGPADFQQDPGYAFRLAEGQKALERSAAAKGGILTGGALKAATRYGQDMASQEYNNTFNRFNVNQTNKYNRFANIAGLGQTSANQLGAYGQNYANQAGNLMFDTGQGLSDLATQAANARASGYVQGGNIWGGLLNNIGNNVSQTNLLNQILRGY